MSADEQTSSAIELERARAGSNGSATVAQRRRLVQGLGRLFADQIQKRIPKADLDERDPDYIRELLPGTWLLASIYFRGRREGAREDPRGGPGADGGQPLGRQPDARHARLHARVHHLLRRRAALLPARPQPRAGDARARLPAQVRHRRRLARERRPGARPRRRAARLPGRRLRGAPPLVGDRRRSTSTAARAGSGARSRRTCRSSRSSRWAARRPRCSSAAASGSPSCCGSTRRSG